MRYLALASLFYGSVLSCGILFWAWRNSVNRLFVSRGLPPSLTARFPRLSKRDRWKAFGWGVPVLLFMFSFPLGYSIYCRSVLGDGIFPVLLCNLTLLMTHNLFDLVVVDWIVICRITPRFLVVPGTEGDPGYKDYAFHLRGAIKGLVFVVVGSLSVSALAELAIRAMGGF